MEEEKNEFGQFLRQLRKEKQVTARKLALLSGVSQAYITNIENGKRGVPSAEVIKKLARALDVAPTALMKHAGFFDFENLDKIDELKQLAGELTKEEQNFIIDIVNLAEKTRELLKEALSTLAPDGFFPDFLHEDIFLLLKDVEKGPLHENYPDLNYTEHAAVYSQYLEDRDDYSEEYRKEIEGNFNEYYNAETLLEFANEGTKTAVNLLAPLKELADKYQLNEKKAELMDFLKQPGVTFNGIPLTDQDRTSINLILSGFFLDRLNPTRD